MSQLTMKEKQVVAREIRDWIDESLIKDELAKRLLERYPIQESAPNAAGVITLIGSILVGLGTLLFIAANWQAMAIAYKLLAIVLAIGLTNFCGWRLRFEPGDNPKLGAGLIVLGNIFFGGAIWLVSQIYNFDTSLTNGLLIWGVGALSMAYVTRLVPLGYLTSLVLAAYTLALRIEVPQWESALPYLAVTTAILLGLGQYLRSRGVVWIAMLSATLWLCSAFAPVQVLLLWGLTMFAAFLYCKEKRPLLQQPFLYLGTGSVLMALLSATFSIPHSLNDVSQVSLLLITALASLAIVIWQAPRYMIEAAAGICLALVGCLLYGYADGAGRIVFNVVLLAAIAGLAYSGLHRLKSPGVVSVALIFFVFDVIARYFDFFFTTMDRSLFFIVGGVVLMTVGTITERGRRRLIDGLKTA